MRNKLHIEHPITYKPSCRCNYLSWIVGLYIQYTKIENRQIKEEKAKNVTGLLYVY